MHACMSRAPCHATPQPTLISGAGLYTHTHVPKIRKRAREHAHTHTHTHKHTHTHAHTRARTHSNAHPRTSMTRVPCVFLSTLLLLDVGSTAAALSLPRHTHTRWVDRCAIVSNMLPHHPEQKRTRTRTRARTRTRIRTRIRARTRTRTPTRLRQR